MRTSAILGATVLLVVVPQASAQEQLGQDACSLAHWFQVAPSSRESVISVAQTPQRWRLVPDPIELAAATDLFRVTSAFFDEDGRLALANAGRNEILLFDHDGSLATRIDTRDEDTQELGQLFFAHKGGDGRRIAAFDGGLRAVKEFSPRGQLLRTVPLRGTVGSPPFDAFPLPDGGLVIHQQGMAVGFNALRQVEETLALILRWHPSTESLREVAVMSGEEFVRVSQQPSGFSLVAPPFATRAWLIVDSGCLIHPLNNEPSFALLSLEGDIVLDVTLSFLDLGVGPDEWARRLQQTRAAAHDEFPELPRPEQRPAWSTAVYDGATRLWLEEYHHRDESARGWWIVQADERTASFLPAPPRTERVLAATPDRVALLLRDGDGREQVRVFGLQR